MRGGVIDAMMSIGEWDNNQKVVLSLKISKPLQCGFPLEAHLKSDRGKLVTFQLVGQKQ